MRTNGVRILLTLGVLISLAAPTMSRPAEGDALEKVDAKYVCMVNDAAYDREQVAVDVEEKTYYGCCHMCKARLEENETLRTGTDPISGEEVDKATAVIAADRYNRVHYFANEENLEEANRKLKER